jgi:serine/threonine protein kinase
MSVNLLLERMRKMLQEKAVTAAGGGTNKNDEDNNNNSSSNHGLPADDSGPSSSTAAVNGGGNSSNALPSSSSSSHRAEAALPLPPPVFASPSSARLDYRDTLKDPLCVPFTADMAACVVAQLLEPPPQGTVERPDTAATADTTTTTTTVATTNDAGKSSGTMGEVAYPSSSSSAAGQPSAFSHGGGQSSPCASLVVDAVVRHLREVFAVVEKPQNVADETSPREPSPPSSSPLPVTQSLYDDTAYHRACACSRMDVSGAVRPMCRDVNCFTRVGRISQGVYGVVFHAVAAADYGAPYGGPTADSSKPLPSRPRKSYALKHIKKMWLEESQIGFPPYLLREIDLLLRLKHPNIMGARELVLLDPTPLPRPQPTSSASPHATRESTAGSSSSSPSPPLPPLSHRRPRGDGEGVDPGDFDDDSAPLHPLPPQQQQKKEHTSVASDHMAGRENTAAAAVRPLAAVGALSETKDVFLVMDFCPFDLNTYMRRYHTTPTCQIPYFHMTTRNAHPAAAAAYVARAKSIAYQLFRAVAFLHANRVMHRDLKTSNVLLDDDGYVKVCDFGLGRLYREGQGLTPTVVTLMYRAPELHLGVVDYSHKMDVWSLGCIMAELFLRRPLFHASTDSHHLLAVCDVLGIPTEDTFPGLYHLPQTKVMMQSLPRWNRVSRLAELFKPGAMMFTPSHGDVPVAAEAALLPPEGLALLQSILQWNPRRRPSAEEVLRHPFFHSEPLPCAPGELMRPMPWRAAESCAAELRRPPPAMTTTAPTMAAAPPPTAAAPSVVVQNSHKSLPAHGGRAEALAHPTDGDVRGASESVVTAPGTTGQHVLSLYSTANTANFSPTSNDSRGGQQPHGSLLDDAESPGRGPGQFQRRTLDAEGDVEAEKDVRLVHMKANEDTDEVEGTS